MASEQTESKDYPHIFSYLDYRKFVKDLFFYKKRNGSPLSYRNFARLAGFRSPNFLKLIMDGKRNLSTEMSYRFARAFRLKQPEAQFFIQLVLFNQAKDVAEQKHHYEQIVQSSQYRKVKQLESYQYDYFSKWYMVALRELVIVKGFQEDPKLIRQRLGLELKDEDIRQAVAMLLRLGLLARDAEGRLIQADHQLKTAPELEYLSVINFHREMITKAYQSIEKTYYANRDLSTLTISVNKRQFERIKEEISLFRSRIHQLAESDGDPEAVYQMNFQLFNLSEVPW